MNENQRLAGRMAKLYAKLLGELERLQEPPKRLLRLIPDREAFAAAAPEREKRCAEIEEALPHVAFVVAMLDPSWDRASVEAIRPREPNRGSPSEGISGAAMDALRDAVEPLSIAEIVAIIGERFGWDLTSVPERQRYHTAVNNGLMHSFREDMIKHPGYPTRWSWRQDD